MLLTDSNNHPIETLRHSFAHVLAHAVSRLYPGVKLGIGPATSTGFYYDIDLPQLLKQKDLKTIKEEMQKIISEDLPFTQLIVQREQASNMLLQLGQIYKSELLETVPHDDISFYKTGEQFIDLCSGPHVQSTGELGHFDLISISGAYWQADPKRPQMQRVTGIAFKNKVELDAYIKVQEDIINSNHLKIGKEMELFYFEEKINQFNPVWREDGQILYKELTDYVCSWLSHNDFNLFSTPQISSDQEALREMAVRFGEEEPTVTLHDSKNSYHLKKDVYLGLLQLVKYSSSPNDYSQERIAEVTKVFNDTVEIKSLTNSQQLQKTAAIVISDEKHIQAELTDAIKMASRFLATLGFDSPKLTLHIPDYNNLKKYNYQEQEWEDSISIIKETLKENNFPLKIAEGGCYYYGPKIGIKVKDRFNRYWDISSIGLDLIHPQYVNIQKETKKSSEDSKKMFLNISLVESVEQVIALLLEQTGGSLPLWLAPKQVAVLPISEQYVFKSEKILQKLKDADIRAYIDSRDEKMETKVREAQVKQVPYMLIIGEKEVSTNSISVRPRSGPEIGLMRTKEFIEKLNNDISSQL